MDDSNNKIKESRFKLGIPRMFKSSYSSCRSRLLSDTVGGGGGSSSSAQPFSSDLSQSSPSLPAAAPAPSPKPTKLPQSCPNPFPSICQPKSLQTLNSLPQKNPSNQKSRAFDALFCSDEEGLQAHCLPTSPISSIILDWEFYQNPRRIKIKRKLRKQRSASSSRRFSSRRISRVNSYDSSSSDDNDDEFFSSKSRSSDSSESLRMSSNHLRSSRRSCKEIGDDDDDDEGVIGGGLMKDSVAVVKCSSDPYEDFRTSMVEMIVEKQILGGKDLETLLQSFLALNSQRHHQVILEVFMEIWEALFSDWG